MDFDGLGGMAHIIEDTAKFGKFRVLDTLANGPLGNIMVNLKHPTMESGSFRGFVVYSAFSGRKFLKRLVLTIRCSS